MSAIIAIAKAAHALITLNLPGTFNLHSKDSASEFINPLIKTVNSEVPSSLVLRFSYQTCGASKLSTNSVPPKNIVSTSLSLNFA